MSEPSAASPETGGRKKSASKSSTKKQFEEVNKKIEELPGKILAGIKPPQTKSENRVLAGILVTLLLALIFYVVYDGYRAEQTLLTKQATENAEFEKRMLEEDRRITNKVVNPLTLAIQAGVNELKGEIQGIKTEISAVRLNLDSCKRRGKFVPVSQIPLQKKPVSPSSKVKSNPSTRTDLVTRQELSDSLTARENQITSRLEGRLRNHLSQGSGQSQIQSTFLGRSIPERIVRQSDSSQTPIQNSAHPWM
jgi:hypothetical protein